MPEKDLAIVFDCGATNLRVIAMDIHGEIVASESTSNNTSPDPEFPGGVIWDVEEMWGKLCSASQKVMAAIDTKRIAGVTVTTFGVDGAFVDKQGKMLYPVISWQCQRTTPVMNEIGKYIPLEELYAEAGTFPYAFNTINKMVWMKENRPEVIENSHRFLFITSLFIFKLTGELRNDATMAGTSMLMDLQKQHASEKVFAALGISPEILGDIAESGEQAGVVHKKAETETGIPSDVPVFFGGHDTQFAVFGSGANENELVLSSGTWEIIMARSAGFKSTKDELAAQLTTEMDAEKGLFNIGQNYLASGILEWFAKNFYPEFSGDALYGKMIADASEIQPGESTVRVNPAFYGEGGGNNFGAINGLTIQTKRGEIYRAFLESLAYRLRFGVEALENAGGFKAEKIICVGGGSKNNLWNQLRADVCNLPIQLVDQKETTVLGAALFVFAGCGVAASPREARKAVDYKPQVVLPSDDQQTYDRLYHEFKKTIQ
ncbi:L-fuculokinase [Draconibacterium sp. IB214405]|uniref:L-fuculokinase n=1 Tax=Draconibacterium sp. IB214405 TaxID=3097352 RepID=UPI002A147A39|nr:L-fuculokinase [Draconibacterium sp. IB214405]MDX8338899.1 L-fuculokinase [Draconibacterium sp. IB214405]